ncbi:LysR family transcriptional regulator [Ochrobactrum cytisi]|nr:LysR family transcriptional regulator [Brucella cytisi]
MRNLNSLPLAALRTIEAIGRTGTLAAAACELGVTHGALSQRLAKAEIALGQSLFVRSSYGLEPTEKCRTVLPRLTEAVLALSEVVTDLRDPDEASLSITMAPDFASHWFVRRATHFLELNPDISIRVDPNRSIIDLDTESGTLASGSVLPTLRETQQRSSRMKFCSPSVRQRSQNVCVPLRTFGQYQSSGTRTGFVAGIRGYLPVIWICLICRTGRSTL